MNEVNLKAGDKIRLFLSEKKSGVVASRFVAYIILSIGAVFALAPLVFMLLSTFKTQHELLLAPPPWFSKVWTLDHYRIILFESKMARAFINSVIIATCVVIGNLGLCSMAGYAFAKLRWVGKEMLFIIMLFTMMIPGQLTLIPSFLVMKAFHWIDTWFPLIIPGLIGAFGIFLMRQYMVSIPESLLEASRLDGNTEFGVLFRVVLPVCKPPLITLGLLTFQGAYNNLMGPLIYLKTPTKYTVPMILAFFQMQYRAEMGPILTASFISIIPLIIAYSFFQRYFIQGLTMSGLK